MVNIKLLSQKNIIIMKTKCTIVVPCYNEGKRLKCEDFSQFIKKHQEFIFLFINDGSTDNTGFILKTFCSNHSNVTFLELNKNYGKAEAIRLGILHIIHRNPITPFIGFCDADLATPLNELHAMLNLTNDNTLFISGCRIKRLGSTITRKATRHILGRIFATAVSLHLNLPIYDTQCGAKIYNSSFIAKVFQKPFVTKWFFDVEILRRLITIYGKKYVIDNSLEYPLQCWIEKTGSKINFYTALTDFIKLLFTKD